MLRKKRHLCRFLVMFGKAAGVILVMVWGGAFVVGCSDSESTGGGVPLARLGGRVLTVADFEAALDVALAAYPPEATGKPEVLADVRRQLLAQLVEEMVLEAEAESIGIAVTDAEIDRAVADIKKDYPDDTFEEMLLENAVPFNVWRKRLKMRLLMEKVIDSQLAETVQVTPEDIAGYYKIYGKPGSAADDPEAGSREAEIVRQIRQQKLEAAYSRWMTKAKRRFRVEIDDAAWKASTGSL